MKKAYIQPEIKSHLHFKPSEMFMASGNTFNYTTYNPSGYDEQYPGVKVTDDDDDDSGFIIVGAPRHINVWDD